MKKSITKLITRIVCLVLCTAMLVVFSLNAFADAKENEKLYIKDVKLIYAESEAEARTHVPEGYIFQEKNLNEGADTDQKVYFAYSVTKNPDEAVTDIKMMNMKGGFVLSDYEEQMKDVNDKVKKLANDVKIAADTFITNYVKGTYGAKAAYRALSAFTVDDEGKKTLADYLVYENVEDDFYVKFVLNAHQNVLTSVLSALVMAVQGEPGNTWLDRLAKIKEPGNICEQPTYWDDSVMLWEHFYGFYNAYNTIDHSLYNPKSDKKPDDPDAPPAVPPVDTENQPEIEYNGTEALYEVVYKTLESYKFGNGDTFSKWFLDDEVFEPNLELFENFYCILEVMTPEELAMMRLCGPLYMILATGMDEAAYQDYMKRIEEITGGESACSIWAGVNTELFRSSIGITDEAARKIAQSEFERELNNEGDGIGMAGLKTAGLIAACGAVSLGLSLATYLSFGSLIFTAFSGYGLTTAATVVSVGAQIFMSVSMVLGVTAVVVALVVAVVFLVIWIAEILKENHPEYTEIPEFMYDYVEDGAGNSQFILYEGLRFQDGKVADVNVWEGKEWHAMYVSYDKAAGAPIEADVIVRYGDGHIDNNYAGLSSFGHINAQNLNAFDFDDDVNGIFITYRQEKLKGDYARKDYLSDAKLFSGEDKEKVALELKNQNYMLHDVNLTPDSDYVTYLGYKTTNSESRALTDIRLAYGYNATQYVTGGSKASYGASGSTGDGMLTLYVTTISLFGTPIRSDFLILGDRNAPAGYEPVNLFSGGPAVNINLGDKAFLDTDKRFYFYFLPSETYTSGTQYIGGLSVAYDVPSGASTNNRFSISKVKEALGYQVFFTSYGTEHAEAAIIYSTTYNPYRAIYNVTAAGSGGDMGSAFAQTMAYDGVIYSLATRYQVTANEKVRFESATQLDGDARLYVAGVYPGGSPLHLWELYASNSQDGAPAGLAPVSARLSDSGRAVNLGGGFNFTIVKNATSAGGTTVPKVIDVTMAPFYLFMSGRDYKEGNYLTNIYLASKDEIINSSVGADIDCDDLDNSYVMNRLAELGAHRAVVKNLNLEDGDNVTFLGYSKMLQESGSARMVKPITDIVLYYAKDTDSAPEMNMTFGKIKYDLAGAANIFGEEGESDSKCDRVYLYFTTNPAAGSPIIDIQIDNTAIVNGWETVRTQNKKALYDDMDAYSRSMWFIHMKRITDEPKYISEVVIGVGGNDAEAKAVLLAAGCDYMLEKDLNNNVGAHSDYIYLGYKRTSDPSEAIRDLRTTHNDEVDSFVKNGATYYKIDGNLNSYTNVFADDIFLYYTRDSKAGTPITSLGTSRSVANWTHGEGGRYVVITVLNQYDKASDLNDGALGDYIYLLQTRDRDDEKGLASMIGGGSVIAIVGFILVSVGVVVWMWIVHKKRRVNEGGGTDEANVAEIAPEENKGD